MMKKKRENGSLTVVGHRTTQKPRKQTTERLSGENDLCFESKVKEKSIDRK